MSTLTFTFAAGSETGALIRRLAKQLENAAAGIPDTASTGSSTTLVLDNAPSAGVASVQVTGGPYQSSKLYV